ncbi:hypothetical protein V6N13_083899 [Hibiscus sabdariffa]
MEMICSVSSIHSRLMKWGLGEINVQRLGAKTFLLMIEDEDLILMLEDVDLWGTFEALGVNANHTLDCEKANVLITTEQVRCIEEIVELEVGEKVFLINVKEIGFTDETRYPLCNIWNGEKGKGDKTEDSESISN